MVVPFFRYLLAGALAVALSGCAGMASLNPGNTRPLAQKFEDNPMPGGRPNASGAIYTAQYAPGQGPVIERGSDAPGTMAPITADPELARKQVVLSFVETDVREFARVFFSEMLKKPYVVGAEISGSVTLRSGGSVDGNAAIALARQALETTGNTITLSDGVYRVMSISGEGGGVTANVRAFQLVHVDAESARRALQPLIEGRAEIVSATSYSLNVRGDNETLALVGSMLDIIDVNRFKSASFGLFPLKRSDAVAVAEELRILYQGVGITSQTLLPIQRMNAVLVIAERSGHLDFAQKWVERLDQGPQNTREIYVYQVQNREAAALATLLREIFASAQLVVASATVTAPEGSAEADVALPIIHPDDGSPEEGIKVTADPGSNTLIIWAKSGEYEIIERALRRLDTPLRQVYVETTIAEVRLNDELSHGVRWFLESGAFSAGLTESPTGVVGPDYPGFNFSFKVPQAQLVISALEGYTDVRIVSSPQLTVVDRETATIQVGDQVPIVTKTIQDTTSGANVIANEVQFRDTGVILNVTPQIRSSGEVLLDIQQEVSQVHPTTSSSINSPTISQRKVSSTVLVPDGTAIVLGGLISTSEEASSSGLPGTQRTILESIFGSKKMTAARSELIIIIRPVIIQDQSDMREVIAEIASKMGNVMSVEVN